MISFTVILSLLVLKCLKSYFLIPVLSLKKCKNNSLLILGSDALNKGILYSSFNVFLSQCQNYLGQEENQKTWALGKLRLMAYGKSKNSIYDYDDSINNWPNSSNKFDLIISIPPIGFDLRPQKIRGKSIHTYRRVGQLLLERSTENLSPTGKVITIVPLSFLQRSHGKERILKSLIEKDLNETIILLPKYLFKSYSLSEISHQD